MTLTFSKIRQVREQTGIDLQQVVRGGKDRKLPAWLEDFDIVAFSDVLWVVCRADAEAENISEDEFMEALDMGSLETGAELVLCAVVRLLLPKKAAKAAIDVMKRKKEVAEKQREEALAKLDRILKEQLEQLG